ncbi:hypothetical protein LCGC14_0464820 [marine sediment metagenome]|uniref:Uncharacterized protein n=1 Tax=marine sediment metagenome TaxID=412755 RepID=A0A0F9SE38_9ZZZZ
MDKEMWRGKNQLISDIVARLMPDLPIHDMRHRENLKKEWRILEERIEEYYIPRQKVVEEGSKLVKGTYKTKQYYDTHPSEPILELLKRLGISEKELEKRV